ncbi:MAG: hypothetical protein M3Z54_02660 [Gemmatimonadota bacterium]|nr:hypothetical protein [Gemmatimonadota bacterium]
MDAAKVAVALVVVALATAGTISARGPAGFAGLRNGTPDGWVGTGTRPQDYRVTIANDSAFDGGATAHLRGRTSHTNDFGTLMQSISARHYRGQRVRFAGQIRIENVINAAALWLRADDACGRVLTFDSTEQHSDRGTAGWRTHTVVFDVPADAQNLYFGTLVVGSGDAWIRDLHLEVVGNAVPVTAAPFASQRCSTPAVGEFRQLEPRNLDFTQG